MELVVVEGALNVLSISVQILDDDSDSAHIIHKVLSELFVIEYPFLMVLHPEFTRLMHRVAVEKPRSRKSRQIFGIGIRSEYESGRFESERFVRERVDFGLLRGLVVSEAERLAGHLGDEGFTETQTSFHVDFFVFAVGGVGGVDHVGDFRGHDAHHEHGHVHRLQTDADLLGGQESPIIELACPHHLDGLPGLVEVLLRHPELNQALPQESVILIFRQELQRHHQVFALVQYPVHLLQCLHTAQLLGVVCQLPLDVFVQVECVLQDFERDAPALRQLDPLLFLQTLSQNLDVVGLGAHVLRVELLQPHERLLEIRRHSHVLRIIDYRLQYQRTGCTSRYRKVWPLLLESDLVVLDGEEHVLADALQHVLDLRLVETHYEHRLQVAGTHTHVSQHVRVIGTVYQDNSLYVGRHFLLSIDFFAHQYGPLLVHIEHDFAEVLDFLRVPPAPMRSALTDHQPVAQVGVLPDLRVDLLHDHRQRKEQCAADQFLRKDLVSELVHTEIFA